MVLRDGNAKIVEEKEYQPIIDKYSIHKIRNNNDDRLIEPAMEERLIIKSKYFKYKNKQY